MREMKDSGIEWIGMIPKQWKKQRIKYVCSLIGSGATPSSDVAEYYDGDVNWIQSGDIYGVSEITSVKTKITELGSNSSSALKIYSAPFIVVAMYGASIGNTSISKINACTNQACCCLKTNTNNDLKFLYYWIEHCKTNFLCSAIGGTQPNISQDKIKNQIFVAPAIKEQQQIVTFLDSKCASIDEAISRQKEAIEKLEEYKRSTIIYKVSHSDAKVEYVTSGIPWMPKMPKTWEILPLKYAVTQRVNKNIGMQEKNLLTLSYGEIKRKNIDTNEGLLPASFEGYNIVEKGDIVLRLLDLQNDTRSLRTGLVKERGIITSAYVTITPFVKFDSSYCRYLLHAYDLMKVLYTMGEGVRQSLSFDELSRKVLVPVPPIEEQKKISKELSIMESNVNETINRIHQIIEKLEEYKKSLIYNAVTGKIDCRK